MEKKMRNGFRKKRNIIISPLVYVVLAACLIACLVVVPKASSDTKINIKKWVTKARVEKQQGKDRWEKAKEITDQDELRLVVDYSVPKGGLGKDYIHTALIYNLPSGCSITKKKGEVYASQGKESAIGTYKRLSSEQIEITYSREFLEQHSDQKGFTSELRLPVTIEEKAKKKGNISLTMADQMQQTITYRSLDANASINLEGYITSASFDREEMEEGESTKLSIGYEIPSSTLKDAGTNTLTYTLPDGITAKNKFAGQVYDDHGNAVGTYTIEETSMTIELTEEFVDSGEVITGSIGFWVGLNSSGDDKDTVHKYEFSASKEVTAEILIKQETSNQQDKKDIKVKKELDAKKDEKGNYTLSYTVTIGTEKGTDGTIQSFTDWFNAQQIKVIKADLSAMSLVKYNASHSVAEKMKANEYFMYGEDGNLTLKKDASLPALLAGESYQLTYQVSIAAEELKNINGTVGVTNTVNVKDHSHDVSTSTNYQIKHTWISKQGSYDASTGQIIWTVTVNDFGADLSGYQLDDVLSSSGVDTTGMKVSVQEYGASGKEGDPQEVTLPLVFHEDNTITDAQGKRISIKSTSNQFVLTYTTNVNATGYYKEYTNKAEVSKDGEKHETETTVKVNKKDTLTKEFSGAGETTTFLNPFTEEEMKGISYNWTSTIKITSDGIKKGSTYTDRMLQSEWNSEKGIPMYYHFTTYDRIESLKEGIALYKPGSATPDQTLIYNQDYSVNVTYLCGLQQEKTIPLSELEKQENPNGTIIAAYEIVFEKELSSDFDRIELSYQTFGRTEDLAFGVIRKYINKAGFTQDGFRQEDSAETTYNRGGAFAKEDAGGSETGEYDYDDINGILYYRLKVNVDATMKGDIKITDTLPKGTTLYEDPYTITDMNLNGYTQFFENKTKVLILRNIDGGLRDKYYHADRNEEVTAYDLGAGIDYDTQSNILQITIPETVYYFTKDNEKKSHPLVIYYAVKITDEAKNKDEGKDYESYTNHATMENGKETVTESVTNKVTQSPVSKKAKDAVFSDNRMTYSVQINPNGADLVTGGDHLTLKDTVDLSAYKAYVKEISLVPGSIHLYELKSDGSKGKEVSTTEYKVTASDYQEGSGTYTMSLEVLDGHAYLLEYAYAYILDDDALYNDNITSIPVKNSITMSGTGSTIDSSQVENKYEVSGSEANARTNGFQLWKLDEENMAVVLPGAVFKLQKWTGSEWKDVTVEGSNDQVRYYTTGEDGKVSISLQYNTAYRIVEVSPPNGYQMSGELHYVYMSNLDTGKYPQCVPEGYLTGDNYHVHILENRYVTITNEKKKVETTSIAVQKKWEDGYGEELHEGLPSSIKLTLYQTTKQDDTTSGTQYEAEGYASQVILTPDNDGNWYYSFNSLPKEDEEGHKYYYYVKEDPVDGYITSYDNSAALDAGTIIITNKKELTSLNVQKVWKSSGGALVPEQQSEITIAVFTSAQKLAQSGTLTASQNDDGTWSLVSGDSTVTGAVFDGTYQVTSKEDWSWSKNYNLPKSTYFYVVELTNKYVVSYQAGDADVQYTNGGGTVTITNTVQSIKLPLTGAKVPILVFLVLVILYLLAGRWIAKLKRK